MTHSLTRYAAYAAATLALLAPLAALPAPAAHADRMPEPCVSKAEFRRLAHGMTQDRAYQITGARGKVTSRYDSTYYRAVHREYRACTDPRWGFVSVTFSADRRGVPLRLDSKSAYWA